jgi:HAE1 family hydrophobic/amphiphilic exporter-1
MGHSPKEAASVATRQIALAVMTTTLSVVAVFIPIAFVKGMIGRIFYQFGLTVTFAVLISLFVSFTLNPMFSAYFLKQQKSNRFYDFLEKIFRSIEKSYRRLIQYSLTHRKTVLAITAVCLLSAFVSAKWIKFEFRPMEDQSQFQVVVNMPKGSSIDVTKHYINRVETILKTQPWLSYTFSTVGGNQMQSTHNGTVYVKMIEKKERSISQEKAMEQMRALLANLPEGKPA